MMAGQRPPLPCQASPPLGGKLDVTSAFANLYHWRSWRSGEAANLPRVGEMSGRTEGARRIATGRSFRAVSSAAMN
ncbi:hypothetical protein EN859_024190 [Mesorhizobium sp. M00.F.Ca.ET.216.01.1.1]|nr:hypothetical protein EN859_024190 [Mesorhizobium sp. M00.F.Ca.ET.216.01.1.1]